MFNTKDIETTTQEVSLLLTLVGSLSLFVGSYLFISMDNEMLTTLTGSYGQVFFQLLFDMFGLATFYFALASFFVGKYIISKAQSFKDIYQLSYPIITRITSYFFTIVILASLLSIIENYQGINTISLLSYGMGGAFGSLIGGTAFTYFGLIGSLVLLISLGLVVSMVLGSLQLVNSYLLVKEIIVTQLRNVTLFTLKYLSLTRKYLLRQIKEFSYELSKFLPLQELSPLGPNFSAQELEEESQEFTKPLKLQNKEVMDIIERLDKQVSILQDQVTKQNNEDVVVSKKSQKKKNTTELETQLDSEVNTSETATNSTAVVEVADWKGKYAQPDLRLLAKPAKTKQATKSEIEAQSRELEERLESFQIHGKVIAAHVGVSLTMYEFLPSAGVKLSKISALTNDLALVLGASSIRILAPIPGKTTVGIEVPNKEASAVSFSLLIEDVKKDKTKELPIALGLDVYNKPIISDITEMPHILVSGTTGSGKSVFINTLITSLLFNKSPKDLRFLMIDPKMIELSPYNGIPHLLKPVVTDTNEAKDLLVWAENEMDKRYQMFSDVGARNIVSFNEAIKSDSKSKVERKLGQKIDWSWQHMPYIVIVIDELADLMLTQGKEVEIPITRIAQKARAAGIHLVIATQRPSAEIVTGLIKTNFPTRISFKVSSAIDSRTILDTAGGEKLLGKGDMLYMPNGKSLVRLQGAFVSELEVKKIVKSIS